MSIYNFKKNEISKTEILIYSLIISSLILVILLFISSIKDSYECKKKGGYYSYRTVLCFSESSIIKL